MNSNEDNTSNENEGENEKKDFVFLKAGPVWENTIYLDWVPEQPTVSAAFDGA